MAGQLFDLKGRVALVTGGNSGIGLGMAEGLAAAGADVAIWGVKPERNAAALERLKTHGGRVHAEICDVAKEAEVARALAATIAALGPLDACFANAGVSGRAGTHRSFTEMTTAEWRRVLDVNLDGVFYTLRAAAQTMVKAGRGGTLVVTGSAFAIMGINAKEFTLENMPRLAIRRWGVPEDFAGIAVYLASDASRYMTGATIVIDGGLTIAAKVARDG